MSFFVAGKSGGVVERIRRRGSIGLVAALSASAAFAVGGDVGAADVLAYATVDCTRPGDQFVLADGGDVTTTAAAIDDSGAVVLKLKVTSSKDTPPERSQYFRVATVPPGTDYAAVLFTNADKGLTQTVAPVAETCKSVPVNEIVSSPGQGLIAVQPQRLLDTRVVRGSNQTPTPVAAGATIEVAVLGEGTIPRDAAAVMLNVGAVQPESVGHLRVFPCGTALPKTSALNYVAGETRAADVFVRPGAGGKVCIYSASRTHVIADVQGYVPAGSQPYAIPPVRVVDTRVGAPVDGPGLLPRKKVNDVVGFGVDELAAAAGLPDTARSFVINVTATNATQAGFVSVNDCGQDPSSSTPRTSTLNFSPGRATANLAVTKTDFDRLYINSELVDAVCLYANRPVDLIIDVTGYSTSPYVAPVTVGDRFRALDTRPNGGVNGTTDNAFSGTGRLKAGVEYKIGVGGRKPDVDSKWQIPLRTSVLLNVTAIRPDANGHVTVYECGKRPGTSNVNVRKGDTVANSAYVQLDRKGDVCVYSSVVTDLVLDVAGYGARSESPTVLWDQIQLSKTWPKLDLPIVGGTPPYRVVGSLPASAPIDIDANGLVSFTGDADANTYYNATVTISDARGLTVPLNMVIVWLPYGADYPPPVPFT